jgi:hypothetical protein
LSAAARVRERGKRFDHAKKHLAQLPPQSPVAYCNILAFEGVQQLDGPAVRLSDRLYRRVSIDVENLIVVGPGSNTSLNPIDLLLYFCCPLFHRLLVILRHVSIVRMNRGSIPRAGLIPAIFSASGR